MTSWKSRRVIRQVRRNIVSNRELAELADEYLAEGTRSDHDGVHFEDGGPCARSNTEVHGYGQSSERGHDCVSLDLELTSTRSANIGNFF